MTRDELMEKVANAICESRHDEFNWWDTLDGAEKHQFRLEADAAIETIFAAMKEPTEEMTKQGARYNTGTKAYQVMHWQAMLSASPLAPSKER